MVDFLGGYIVTLEWLVGFVDMFWAFCVGVVLASWDFVVFCVGNNSDDGITSSRLTCSRVTPDECKLV